VSKEERVEDEIVFNRYHLRHWHHKKLSAYNKVYNNYRCEEPDCKFPEYQRILATDSAYRASKLWHNVELTDAQENKVIVSYPGNEYVEVG